MKNKLKLHENEQVYCNTFEIASKCCELAHSLGVKWYSPDFLEQEGESFMNKTNWGLFNDKSSYDFIKGEVNYIDNTKPTITGIEWLNRHDIFVLGQSVMTEQGKRTFIHDNYCVMHSNEELNNHDYIAKSFLKIDSIYPIFRNEEGKKVIIDGKEYFEEDIIELINKQ